MKDDALISACRYFKGGLHSAGNSVTSGEVNIADIGSESSKAQGSNNYDSSLTASNFPSAGTMVPFDATLPGVTKPNQSEEKEEPTKQTDIYTDFLTSNSDEARMARVIFRETEGIRPKSGVSNMDDLTEARADLAEIIAIRKNTKGTPIGKGTQPDDPITGSRYTDIVVNQYPPSVKAWKSSVDAAIREGNRASGNTGGSNLFNFRPGSAVDNSPHTIWKIQPNGNSTIFYNSNGTGDLSKGDARFYYFKE